jgi:cytochrome c oxidase cbb3-type subunit 3
MHRSKSVWLLSTLLTAAVWPALAQPPAAQPPTPARRPGNTFLISRDVPDQAAVDRGQGVFVASCGFCHGSSAKGGEGGPDLIRSVLALDDEGGDKIGPIIHNGSADKRMPPFPAITEPQIKDIAAFLRSRQQAAINRGAYPLLELVTGDAKQGKAYFNGAGQCKSCHSTTGDLAGIGKKYDASTLQGRFLYPEARRRGPAQSVSRMPVTVTLPSGQSVSGNLEYLDDFNVALREASGDYRSFSRNDGLKVNVKDPLAAHENLLKSYSDADMHNMLAYLVTLK